MMEMFKQKMTKDQSRDTGMAMVLLVLIFYIKTRRDGYLWAPGCMRRSPFFGWVFRTFSAP